MFATRGVPDACRTRRATFAMRDIPDARRPLPAETPRRRWTPRRWRTSTGASLRDGVAVPGGLILPEGGELWVGLFGVHPDDPFDRPGTDGAERHGIAGEHDAV